MMQKYYRAYQPENPPMHREYMSGYSNYNNNDNIQMSKPEINKVVNMVQKNQMSLLQSIQKFIVDTKLLNYLLAALITSICTKRLWDLSKEMTD